MNEDNIFPDPPSFSPEDMEHCRDTRDYVPVIFVWYEYVFKLCTIVSHIQRDSPAFRPIRARNYYVLMGLLHRCAKLMAANMALSHEGKFGEATSIIDRCIFESAINIMWLCVNNTQEEFTRFLADGLRSDLEMKAVINNIIRENGGTVRNIEHRMISSINSCITASGLEERDISLSKKKRDVASIMDALGYRRLSYIAQQKMGSHNIHGTWTCLLNYYLTDDDEPPANCNFSPRGHDCPTHVNQYASISTIVLKAMAEYLRLCLDNEFAIPLIDFCQSISEEIHRIWREAAGDDWDHFESP